MICHVHTRRKIDECGEAQLYESLDPPGAADNEKIIQRVICPAARVSPQVSLNLASGAACPVLHPTLWHYGQRQGYGLHSEPMADQPVSQHQRAVSTSTTDRSSVFPSCRTDECVCAATQWLRSGSCTLHATHDRLTARAGFSGPRCLHSPMTPSGSMCAP